MKIAIVVALTLAACGKSECQKFATVYCSKMASCGYPQNGVLRYPYSQDVCEKDALEYWAASDIGEDLCEFQSRRVAALNCPQFHAYVSGE